MCIIYILKNVRFIDKNLKAGFLLVESKLVEKKVRLKIIINRQMIGNLEDYQRPSVRLTRWTLDWWSSYLLYCWPESVESWGETLADGVDVAKASIGFGTKCFFQSALTLIELDYVLG